MSDPTCADYIGIGGTLAGALVGGLIGLWIARKTVRDQFFYASAAKLKVAFSKELAILKHPEGKLTNSQILDRLEAAFDKHLLAITEFRYALTSSKQISFTNTWCNYYSQSTDCNYVLLTKYSEAVNKNWRQDAIQNIEAILKFAE